MYTDFCKRGTHGKIILFCFKKWYVPPKERVDRYANRLLLDKSFN